MKHIYRSYNHITFLYRNSGIKKIGLKLETKPATTLAKILIRCVDLVADMYYYQANDFFKNVTLNINFLV